MAGTKKRKSKNPYLKCKPILFNSWSDLYTLGIFCKKTNLIDFARKSLSRLRKDTEERRLFNRGINDAHNWTFSDIALSIRQVRDLTGERFDSVVYEQTDFKTLLEIKEAVEEAQDWETPELVERGKEVMDRMCDRRVNTRQEILEEMAL